MPQGAESPQLQAASGLQRIVVSQKGSFFRYNFELGRQSSPPAFQPSTFNEIGGL